MLRQSVHDSVQKLFERGQILKDRAQGLDFLRGVEAGQVGLDPAVAFRSTPSGGAVLKRVLKRVDVQATDRIIDIGCGKGDAIRTLLKAPFAQVDGVELSPEIADIARLNFKKMKEKRTRIFTADAREFPDYSRYNFIYMYNPFPDTVMREVMRAIRANKASDEPLTLIYNNPTCHAEIVRDGRFSKWVDMPGRWDHSIRIYSA